MDPTNSLLLNVSGALAQSVLLGTGLTIVVWAVLRTVAQVNAATRFAIWFGTLVVVAGLSVTSLLPIEQGAKQADVLPAPVAKAAPARVTVVPQLVSARQPAVAAPSPVQSAPRETGLRFLIPVNLVEVAVILYAFTLGGLSLRLLVSFVRLRKILRRSRPAPAEVQAHFDAWLRLSNCKRPARLLLSADARSPMAVGFRRPAVIIPDSLLLALTGEDLDHIGLHELAHLCRYDDWTNLIQRLLRAVLFFHPAVHWICRRLEFDREVACDDHVLAITGEPKPYARSLTKVLEVAAWRSRPVLASGAVFGKRQIFRRIEMMLDRAVDKRPRISQVGFAICLVLVVGLASELARLPSLVAFEDGTGTHRSRWTVNDRTIEMEKRGEVEFGDDDASIARMAPGSHFRLEEKRGWTRRRLEARAGATPELKYFVNGSERPLDAEAREWLGRILPSVIRETGYQAEQRAARIIERRGPSGLLEEVDRISSDHVKKTYLVAGIDSGKFSTHDLRGAIQRAGRLSSDHEKANLLIDLLPRYSGDELRNQFFDALDTIQSDHDRRRVLTKVLDDMPADAKLLARAGRSIEGMQSDHDKSELLKSAPLHRLGDDASLRRPILRAAESIQSDSDKASVLRAMLDEPGISEAATAEVLRIAATINSDSDKANVLKHAAERNAVEGSARAAFVSTVKTINSDNDKASALAKMLKRPDLDETTLEAIVVAAEKLTSDNDKANVLIEAAGHGITPSFLATARTINSDNDKRRVLSSVLERNVSAATAKAVVAAAGTLSSDNDKAQVLTAAVERYSDPEVRDEVKKVAGGVHSDTDYRRIVNKLLEAPAERKP